MQVCPSQHGAILLFLIFSGQPSCSHLTTFPSRLSQMKPFFKVVVLFPPKMKKGINYNYNRQPVIMCKNMYKVSQISCCYFLLTRSIYIRWRSTYFLLQKLTFKLSKLVNSWGFSWLYILFIFNIPLQYDVLSISV